MFRVVWAWTMFMFRIICVKGFTLDMSRRVEVVLNVVPDYLKSGLSTSNLLH